MLTNDKEFSMATDTDTKAAKNKQKSGDSPKDRALDSMLGQIERQFGKGSIMRMGKN